MYLVDEIVDQVRDQIDEENVENVSDSDILQAINRAQDFAASILARQYPEPLLAYTTIELNGVDQEYDFPEGVFEDRIEKLEVDENNIKWQIDRIDFRDLSLFETKSAKTDRPYHYALIKKKIRLVPPPTGTYNLRCWYLRNPEKLVKAQGRITLIKASENYIRVDEAGLDLTTENNSLNSYVNLISSDTGEVKGTLQIKTASGGKITFKSTPDRSKVLGKTIIGDLSEVDISEDDYLATVHGSCIPFMQRPLTNFLVQYGVAEIRRRLGHSPDLEYRVLKDFERQVESTWVGREHSLRVSKKSKNWYLPFRRYWSK